MMKQGSLIKGALWLWAGGLACFFGPFLSMNLYRESSDYSAWALMTGFKGGELISEDFPINGYLWAACLAGILCLSCAIHINGMNFKNWREARKSNWPIVTLVSGIVGTICLFLDQEVYGGSAGRRLLSLMGAGHGWGWTLAVLCFGTAVCCIGGAYVWDMVESGEQTVQTVRPQEDEAKPDENENPMRTKLEKLKQQYLAGEITAAEYEREIDLVQKIAQEQPKNKK